MIDKIIYMELVVQHENIQVNSEIIKEKYENDIGFDFYTYLNNIINGYLFIIISLFVFLSLITLIVISILEKNVNNISFWGNLVLKYFIIFILQFITSYFVRNKSLKVNYSRKIMHFSFFLWPQLLDNLILTFNSNIITQFWNIWIVLFTIYLSIHKIRSKIYLFEYLFSAIDRPEDRPFTVQWISFQVLLIFIVLIPFSILFINDHTIPSEWIYIPILVNGIGDGLAEPIGIRFGKHKYKTFACCTKKRYTRSFEGSFWVYASTISIIGIFHNTFNINQLLVTLCCYPVLITFVEALSPHTIDAPFLYGFGYLSLYGIKFIK